MRKMMMGVLAGMLTMAASAMLEMPQIVSHRGESNDRPENSMAAFRLAFERGVDGVECDVYATTDGKGAIIHDATTGRTAGSGTNLTVTDCAWDDLKDVRIGAFGSWVGTDYEGETIPLLDDYLALLASNATTKCVIELKSSANSLVDVVVAAVQAQPLATKERVIFIAFDAAMIASIRTALPDYEAWLLLNSGTYTGATLVSKIQACNATGVDISASATVKAEDIAAVKAAGYKYAVWTCDNAATALSLVEQGVEVITSNTGKTLKDALATQIAELNNWEMIVDPDQPLGGKLWDVGDYVQEGLVGHFDGIRNVGAASAHNSNTSKWKNLVAGNADATLVLNSTEAGSWLRNGFNFNGRGYAQVDSPGLTLGNYLTIQLATDYDYSVQNVGQNRWPNIFAIPSDSGIYFNNNNTKGTRTNTLTWKTEPYGESGNTRRPTLAAWEGKYVTAILGDGVKYLTQGTELDSSVARGATTAVNNQRMTWGGSANNPVERYTWGVVHAVRLYNRALTAAEIAQNRQVDEIRYRLNGANVIVESNTAGLEGTGGNGAYTVNGTHTFTAPASVAQGELIWEPTGYKLELWDAAKSTWDLLRSENALEYVHTNCAARAKVRLTWNWRLAEGVKRIDADDYVQAGLLLQFDGIRNAGIDQPHASDATTWQNLACSYGNAAHVVMDAAKAGAWHARGYDFPGGDYFKLNNVMTLGRQATLQVASDYNDDAQIARYPHPFGCAGDCFSLYTQWQANNTGDDRGDRINFKVDKTTKLNYTNRSVLKPWHGRILNAVLDYNRSGLGQGATLAYKAGSAFGSDVGRQDYCIGTAGGDDSAKSVRMLVGRVYAVRVYDRVLTTSELERNLELDRIRFLNGAGRSTDTDVVEVMSELTEADGEDFGAWWLRGNVEKTWTVTSVVETATATYRCAGYRLETWNATKRAWEWPQVFEGNTCTLTGTNGAANRRVTWLWTPVNALRTAADYDVDDYVQQGLVAHYDGIRNRGVDMPHATKGMAWHDLSHRGVEMELSASGNWGGWTANGLNLDPAKQTYARTTEKLDLGMTNTIQAVLDVNPSEQTQRWPNYIATSTSDHGCFTDNPNNTPGDTLSWKLDTWCYSSSSMRSKVAGWEGKYITSEVTPSQTFMTQTTELGSPKSRNKYGAMDGLYWTLGASGHAYNSDDLKKRSAKGVFMAARFYNRLLTEAELVQNRKVDEIRYRGNFADYRNVMVEREQPFEGATAAADQADGDYEVVGAWTFTAPEYEYEETVGEETRTLRRQPFHKVSTWTDGEWSKPVLRRGGSYTYAAGGAPVKLTWTWTPPLGTSIFVR